MRRRIAAGGTEERRLLTVSQKDCCLEVRRNVFDTWNAKLHHRPSRMDEAAAGLARYNQVEARARSIVAGLPPEPPRGQTLTPPSTPAPQSVAVMPAVTSLQEVPPAPAAPNADQAVPLPTPTLTPELVPAQVWRRM